MGLKLRHEIHEGATITGPDFALDFVVRKIERKHGKQYVDAEVIARSGEVEAREYRIRSDWEKTQEIHPDLSVSVVPGRNKGRNVRIEYHAPQNMRITREEFYPAP